MFYFGISKSPHSLLAGTALPVKMITLVAKVFRFYFLFFNACRTTNIYSNRYRLLDISIEIIEIEQKPIA